MKKLTNVSPFLLLLFPVLIMMIMAMATSNPAGQTQEVATKTTPSASIVKAANAILK
ncbi:MAG: hypothetical protein REI78_08845 [Pedobacter sp.]|nr:hypothetical protein [Pedobacter sp.]MDQ8053123.1 hypothetical protein [Pedobacter sp.]